MNSLKRIIVIVPVYLWLIAGHVLAQQPKQQNMQQLINEQFQFAAAQYKLLDKNIPQGLTPQSFDLKTGKSINKEIQWV